MGSVETWFAAWAGAASGNVGPVGGLTYGGAWFRLYRTPYAGTAQHTIAGWEVEDLEAEVAELRASGVVFEEYHAGELKTVDGIATTRGGRVAWFVTSTMAAGSV